MKSILTSNMAISALYKNRFEEIHAELANQFNKKRTKPIPLELMFHDHRHPETDSDYVSGKGNIGPNEYEITIKSKEVIFKEKATDTATPKKSFTIAVINEINKGSDEPYGTIDWYIDITLSISYIPSKHFQKTEGRDWPEIKFHHDLIRFPLMLLLDPIVVTLLKRWMDWKPLNRELVSRLRCSHPDHGYDDYYDGMDAGNLFTR